jgi:hypothetical protein
MWLLDPDVVYAFGNEDGVTVLATMPGKGRLADFAADREAALLRAFEGLPDGPDLSARNGSPTSSAPGTTRASPASASSRPAWPLSVTPPWWPIRCGASAAAGPSSRRAGSRNSSPAVLLSPRMLLRASRARRRSAEGAGSVR